MVTMTAVCLLIRSYALFKGFRHGLQLLKNTKTIFLLKAHVVQMVHADGQVAIAVATESRPLIDNAASRQQGRQLLHSFGCNLRLDDVKHSQRSEFCECGDRFVCHGRLV